MFHYFKNFCREVDGLSSVVAPLYDEIVDSSHYSTDKQSVEDFMRSVSSNGSGRGFYDFNDGKIPKDLSKVPTDIEIAIRNGALSAAEVQTYLSKLQQDISEAKTKAQKKALEDKQRSIMEARQSYLDSISGFDPEDKENKTE